MPDPDAIEALLLAAADHGVCSCAAMTGGEGPRPIGGGRFYHYTGCDDDPVLRKAIDVVIALAQPVAPAERLREPRTEAGRALLHKDDFATAAMDDLDFLDAILAIEDDAFKLGWGNGYAMAVKLDQTEGLPLAMIPPTPSRRCAVSTTAEPAQKRRADAGSSMPSILYREANEET
jgi:hypothetical protein